MEKVAAWRPVRRGKNDRALTRYKSHYGVNLLDPSPPTDFQPPGIVLGCRLWATSHANSDKVPLSLSLSFSLSLASLAYTLSVSLSLSLSLSLPLPLPRFAFVALHTIPVALRPFCPLHVCLFLSVPPFLFGRPSPPASSQGHPNPHGPEPGNICPRDICVLIESPISSLIERTIGRSFSLSLSLFRSVSPSFAHGLLRSQARSVTRSHDRPGLSRGG